MIFYTAITVIVVVGAIAGWDAWRKLQTPRTELAEWQAAPSGRPLAVVRDGRSFTAKFTPKSKNTPPLMRITASVDETLKPNVFGEGRAYVDRRPYLVMRREAASDRFGKRHGLNREIEVGDAEFDAAVYLESNSPDANVQRTLADPALRKAVRGMLDDGARRLVLGPKGLYAECTIPAGRLPGFGVDETMARLGEIAAALPLYQTGQADKPHWLYESALTTLTIVAVISIIVLGVRAPLDGTAKLVGIGSGLVLCALVTLAGIKLLRGRSDSLSRISSLVVTSLIVLPWGSYEGFCWANQKLDKSPGIDYPTRIVRTWTTTRKSSTYYHIEVAPLRRGGPAVSLNVSAAFAEKAAVGRGIVVTTHEGKLGWEWLDSFYLAR
jgi:hypothetical protein